MMVISTVLRFRDLQNYTTLKRKSLATEATSSFRDLQNYTTLKQHFGSLDNSASFRDLQNYTTLKHFKTTELLI